jgi:hypothetical protein
MRLLVIDPILTAVIFEVVESRDAKHTNAQSLSVLSVKPARRMLGNKAYKKH